MRRGDDSSNTSLVFAKRRDLENHLARGMTQIVLDGTCAGVDLPAHLHGQDQVILNLSYAFHLRVFELDREGVQASLSFSGQEHLCVIPWQSIYFIRLASGEEEGSMYIESMPLSMREQLMRLAGLDLDLDDLDDLDESEDGYSGALSADHAASLDDDELPIVTPPPPRPALRRADQVSEDSLDEDSSWLEQLPQLSASTEVVNEVSLLDEGDEGDEGDDGPISFREFLKKKQSDH